MNSQMWKTLVPASMIKCQMKTISLMNTLKQIHDKTQFEIPGLNGLGEVGWHSLGPGRLATGTIACCANFLRAAAKLPSSSLRPAEGWFCMLLPSSGCLCSRLGKGGTVAVTFMPNTSLFSLVKVGDLRIVADLSERLSFSRLPVSTAVSIIYGEGKQKLVNLVLSSAAKPN